MQNLVRAKRNNTNISCGGMKKEARGCLSVFPNRAHAISTSIRNSLRNFGPGPEGGEGGGSRGSMDREEAAKDK